MVSDAIVYFLVLRISWKWSNVVNKHHSHTSDVWVVDSMMKCGGLIILSQTQLLLAMSRIFLRLLLFVVKRLQTHWTSPILMEQLTMSMAMFNSYLQLPLYQNLIPGVCSSIWTIKQSKRRHVPPWRVFNARLAPGMDLCPHQAA